MYGDTVSAKGVNSGLIFDWLEAVNIVHGESLPACENVTNAEVFDGTLCTRGKQRRHVGHARILRRSRRVPSALLERNLLAVSSSLFGS